MGPTYKLSFKALLLFSVPSILATLLGPLASVVDTGFIGNLDTTSLAALGATVTIFNSFTWTFNFLIYVTTQKLSAFLAKNDQPKMGELFRTVVLMSLGLGILCIFILIGFKDLLYELVGAAPGLWAHMNEYFLVRVYGSPAYLLFLALIGVLQGVGKVHLSFWVVLISTAINIVITYLFLFYWDFGLEGAAWGTLISQVIGVVICLGVVIKSAPFRQHIFVWEWSKEEFLSFGKNSRDIFLRSLSLTTCFFLSSRSAAGLGTESLAAHQVLLQFWLFGAYITDGIAVTATIVGSHFYSKMDLPKLKQVILKTVIMGVITGLIFTLGYVCFQQELISLFTNDPMVIVLILQIWPLIYLFQIINCVAFVGDGVLFGMAGYSYLRTHMGIALFAVFLPFLYWTPTSWGLTAIWAGLGAMNVYRLVTYSVYINKTLARLKS